MAYAYSTRFWNRVARKYAAKPVADEEVYQQKLKETRKWLTPDMDVLEFGCGTGSTALVHAPRVKSYHGLDVSSEMIDIAGEKLAKSGVSNLTFSVGAIEEHEAPDGKYDVILGLSILHLLENPQAVIAKVQRLLKPDGLFVTSTVCIKEFMHWFRLIAPLGSALGLIPKVQFFSRREILDMLESQGFETIFELGRETSSKACFLISRNTQEPQALS